MDASPLTIGRVAVALVYSTLVKYNYTSLQDLDPNSTVDETNSTVVTPDDRVDLVIGFSVGASSARAVLCGLELWTVCKQLARTRRALRLS
jgi:hypothetical protein